jgi:hypothetical protein
MFIPTIALNVNGNIISRRDNAVLGSTIWMPDVQVSCCLIRTLRTFVDGYSEGTRKGPWQQENVDTTLQTNARQRALKKKPGKYFSNILIH